MKFFRPPLPASVKAITNRELDSIAKREGLLRSGVSVKWSETLVDHLAAIGFDARYGAPCSAPSNAKSWSRWLLANPVSEGKAIEADWRDGKCVFGVSGSSLV